jgi:hypothetical protein
MTFYVAGPDGKPLAFETEAEVTAYRRARREAEPPLLQVLRERLSAVRRLEDQLKAALEQRRGRSATLAAVKTGLTDLRLRMREDIEAAEKELSR